MDTLQIKHMAERRKKRKPLASRSRLQKLILGIKASIKRSETYKSVEAWKQKK